MEWIGVASYGMTLIVFAGIYGLLCLGLNVQWGYGGLFNAGIAGFFAIGAYANAIVTSPRRDDFIGGFDLPFFVGWGSAVICSALVAVVIGRICLNLRSDYLALGTIGIAEIFHIVVKSEEGLTRGPFGITDVPRPFDTYSFQVSQFLFTLLVLFLLFCVYLLLERLYRSPWGRVMRAIRDDEIAAQSLGKNVNGKRLEAFVIGSAIMGFAGAIFASSARSINPEAIDLLTATFLVWIMLIAGGAGNNKGAVLGAFALWFIWSFSEIATGFLDDDWAIRAKYIRIFLVGLALQLILRFRPEGLLPERSGQRRLTSASS